MTTAIQKRRLRNFTAEEVRGTLAGERVCVPTENAQRVQLLAEAARKAILATRNLFDLAPDKYERLDEARTWLIRALVMCDERTGLPNDES